MPVKPIPDGYHAVTPYLVVPGAAKLMDFLQRAFGAQEVGRYPQPDGTLMHAEMRIGDSVVMMSDASSMMPAMPACMLLYVTDCDATYKRAVQAGATSVREPENQFYGDRSGGVKDAFGNMWWIATHIEDVAPEEMGRRAQAAMQKRSGAA